MPPKSRGAVKASLSKDQTPESSTAKSTGSKGKKIAPAGPSTDQSGASEPAKKPDTRTLISGSSSWTGKLPVNLISEHCQKNKWEKPEYSMRKVRDGFLSSVTLKAVHPKTKEVTILPAFDLPSTYQHIGTEATAVEARHFAATWALFRVSSMKNIHMMLPPKYKDLWKGEFQEIKNDYEKKGLGWMFEADPFLAQDEQNKSKALMEKKQQEASKKAQSIDNSLEQTSSRPKRDYSRGWDNIPAAEMGDNMRSNVEDVVRKYGVWNVNQVSILELDRLSILDELVKIGFRASHVKEALDDCKDREEVLEWLLIHVPEDDLPAWCLPEGYQAGVSFVTGNIKKESFVKRFSDAGYFVDLEKTWDQHHGDVAAASESLQSSLLGGTTIQPNISLLSIAEDESSTWAEEDETLAAIFSDRYRKLSDTRCSVELQSGGIKYTFQFEKTRKYPATPPVILSTVRTLPAYIKLKLYKKACEYAVDSLLDGPMIFSLCDWLETEIASTLLDPGLLKDIRSAMDAPVLRKSILKRRLQKFGMEHMTRRIEWQGSRSASIEMHKTWSQRQSSPAQLSMLNARRKLPAWSLKDHLVDTVNKNQVTIISGATGSGKSTQSPQFILDDMIQKDFGAIANIVVTQPRRVSALGLADRVSDERCGSVGDEVGYAIRGDTKQKSGTTKITFMTTGILLRRLQSTHGLSDVTHVIIDEIHERTLDSDFLLALMKDCLAKWKDLKLILMSATLDSNVFSQYFKDFSLGILEIQGRTFDVTDHYLDHVLRLTGFGATVHDSDSHEIGKIIQSVGLRINYDLISATVQSIHDNLGSEEGSILIFLPGVAEIDRTVNQLGKLPGIYALPLHASLHPSDQKKVFLRAPGRLRKVVAATNVAETSITIDDCVAVIDTGRVKETSFDPQQGMVKLEEVWASQAACQQRRGRAGRVRPGDCYKLYTRKAEESMKQRPDPEIRRVPLEQLLLAIYALGINDAASFLSKAITPPDASSVDTAIELLRKMNALDNNELTALGQHMSRIPADLRLAKLMIYGAMFNCFEACLNIAAILTVKSPFVSPQQKRDEVKSVRASFAKGQGDLMADLEAYNDWNERRSNGGHSAMRKWCDANFLSVQTLFDINSNKVQFLAALRDSGFLPMAYNASHFSYKSLNANHEDFALIRSLVAGSFSPQFARIAFPDKKYAASMSGAVELDPEAKTIKYFTQDAGRVFVHPGSTLFDAQTFPGQSNYLSFFSKMATSKTFIRDLSPFNVYALLMFAGTIKIDTLGRGLIVDGWLRVRGWARIGVLIGRLRVILDEALERKLENPSVEAKDVSEITDMVRKLIQFCGMDR